MNAVFPPWPIREFRDWSDGIPESGREDSIFRVQGRFRAHKDPVVVRKILDSLGLPSRPPPSFTISAAHPIRHLRRVHVGFRRHGCPVANCGFSIINSVLRGTLEPHAKVPADARFFYTLDVALPNLCYDFYMIVFDLPAANPKPSLS